MARPYSIVARLSSLALRPLLGDGADNVVRGVVARLADSSNAVARSLETAQARAWKSLEIALAGESWWQRCKAAVARSGDERAFRDQIQSFLATVPPAEVGDDFRARCLSQLREARRAGVLPGDPLPPANVPQEAQAFTRYTDPQELFRAEWAAVQGIADELKAAGFEHLARYVSLRPVQGLPLLIIAVRYFFRREVETDEELSRGLTFHQLDTLSREQEAGFRGLGDALARHGAKLEGLLGEVREAVVETRAAVNEVRDIVQGSRDDLDALRTELEEQGRQMREMFAALQQALGRAATPAPVAAAEQREQVAQLLDEVRDRPEAKTGKTVVLVQQLETAAEAYDAGLQRAFPFLSSAPRPRPADAPVAPPPVPSTDRLRVKGPLINEALFGRPGAAPEPEPAPPPPPPPGKKPPVNPLFLRPPTKE
ncbi:MAG TPA: hypothetical protein VM597_15350 [Gemmataceae bacterium]|jgi:hypothetical protein|nr:hypothetical protein [Gemmataceae bacterium]